MIVYIIIIRIMRRFTFGVLAYNQETEIIQTLNSIKFQVQNYGKGINCRLIITDDCSKDNTVNKVMEWLKSNDGLFCDVITVFNTVNIGTVKNYQYILENLDDEPFKIIAGDDLLSSNNIFNVFKSIENHTLYNGVKVLFDKNGVYIREKDVMMHFWMMNNSFTKSRLIRLFRMGRVISTPQTLYRKNLYVDSKATLFNSQFRLFEDNPTWYSMLKNVDDIHVTFGTANIVLYRISEKSVSNGSNKNEIFHPELVQLYKRYISDGGLFEKIFFNSLISRTPYRLKISTYFDYLVLARCRLYCCMHQSKYNAFKTKVYKQVEDGNSYLQRIISMK